MLKRISAAIILFSILLMAGCHTLHGAGEDVESAGKAIERATDK